MPEAHFMFTSFQRKMINDIKEKRGDIRTKLLATKGGGML